MLAHHEHNHITEQKDYHNINDNNNNHINNINDNNNNEDNDGISLYS